MRNLFTFTAFTLLLFASCKQDELTLIHKKSGSLTVQLNDANGAPIADALLALSKRSYRKNVIHEIVTNANGLAEFGALIEDDYTVFGENIKEGELTYSFKKSVLVTSASGINITIVPSEYSSTVEIALREMSADRIFVPLGSDVKVALVNNDDDDRLKAFSGNSEFELLSENIIKEVSGDGTTYDFTFENVPFHNYLVMVYTEVDYYEIVDEIKTFEKDETVYAEQTTVLSTNIRKYEYDQSFTITKRDAAEVTAFADCKIQIVEEEDVNRIGRVTHFDSVAAVSVASSTTDATGKTTFKVRGNRRLYAYFFSSDNTYLGRSRRFEISELDRPIDFEYAVP